MKYTVNQRMMIDSLTDIGKDKRFTFFSLEESINNADQRNIVKFEDCEKVESIEETSKGFISINGLELARNLPICIDFETTGLDPFTDKIKVIGCSNGKRHWYWEEDGEDFFEDCRAKSNIQSFQRFLLLCKQLGYKVIAYNLQFEYKFIKNKFFLDFEFDDDPFIFAYSFFADTCSLSDLAKIYLHRYPTSLEEMAGRAFTDAKPFNWQQDIIETGNLENAIAYCCEDCLETVALMQEFERIGDDQLWELYWIDKDATHTVARMSLRGIKIDSTSLASLRVHLEAYRVEIIEEIKDLVEDQTGDRYFANPKSPKQLNDLFFGVLELDPSELSPTQSGYSVDAKARQILIPQSAIVKKYDDLAKVIDAQNKYANKMESWLKDDGRVHTEFNTCLTTTGRLSSSNPNLQNIPNPDKYRSYGNKFIAGVGERIRGLFIPDDGKILIGCDYSSFELRILAYLSQEPLLIKTFQQGLSLHDVVTEKMFSIVLDKSKPDHVAKRTICKTINFGMAYGMTHHRLYEECKLRGLNWSLEDCKKIISDYWKSMPQLSQTFETLKRESIDKGYSETLLGRRRYYKFSEKLKSEHNINSCTDNDSEQLRQACNHPIQGTNADAIRLAMKKCEDIDPELELLLNIHDEIVFQCPEHKTDEFVPLIKQTMESAIDLGSIPIEAEPKTGYSWSDCK